MRREAVKRVSCDDVAPALFDIVERRDDVSGALVAHVDHCLRCQAEVAQHRKIARTLARTRDTRAEPPADLLLAVLAAVADGNQRDLWSAVFRHRGAYVAAAATAATAGAAAGAFVLTRSRRTRLAHAG